MSMLGNEGLPRSTASSSEEKTSSTTAYSIGWFCVNLAGQEYGPYSLQELRQFLADGTIEADTEIRHCLNNRNQFAGDIGNLGSEVPTAAVRCLRHPGSPAVKFCEVCLAALCTRCGGAPQARLCRSCQNWCYNRRQIAGIIDFYVIPAGIAMLLGWFIDILYQQRDWGRLGFEQLETMRWLHEMSMQAMVVLLSGFLLFKDGWQGRSPGKFLCGLQTVDATTGLPCDLLASFQRNWLLALAVFWWFPRDEAVLMALGVVGVGLWLLETRRSWRDPRQLRSGDVQANTRVILAPAVLERWRRRTRRRALKLGQEALGATP